MISARRATVACSLSLLGCYAPTANLPPDPVYSIEVSPGADTLTMDRSTRRFSAVARDIDDETVPSVTFRWSSADTLVATVDASGLATARAPGTTDIKATARGIVGAATVTVVSVP